MNAKNYPDTRAPEIFVFCLYRSASWLLPVSPATISGWLASMAKIGQRMGTRLEYVELNIVDDGFIARLNSDKLALAGPTNILSFPFGYGGSMALSADTYARECLLYGQDKTGYLIRLLAHGMGHIAGHEHGPRMDSFCLSCERAALSQNKDAGLE